METVTTLVLAGCFVAAVAYSFYAGRKRTAELAELAARLGFNFDPAGIPFPNFPMFKLLEQGSSRAIRNCLSRSDGGKRICIFDFSYVTGSRKHRRSHSQSVVTFSIGHTSLPPFLLRPENLLDKVGDFLGFQDLDFESHPRFSKIYRLQSSSDERVRALFQPGVLQYFENNPGLYLEARGPELLFCRADRLLQPEDVAGLLQEAQQTLALLTSGNLS